MSTKIGHSGQFYEHLKQKNPRYHLLRQDSDIPLEDIPDWDEDDWL